MKQDDLTPLERTLGPKATLVLGCFVLGISAMGFALGIRPAERPPTPPSVRTPAEETAPAAPTYLELAQRSLSPNANFTSSLATLAQPAPPAPPGALDPAARLASLATRAKRRAFDGAPPVIPHAVDATNANSCTACHGDGAQIATTVAKKMPHPLWSQCLQCHVEQRHSRFDEPAAIESEFEGYEPPALSHRAATGAPPITPHATIVRRDCLACHGPLGDVGLRTSHPERQNCLQCHPSSTDLDFRAFESREALLPPIPVAGRSP